MELERSNTLIGIDLYKYEIELIRKMCIYALNSNDFTKEEKRDVDSLLENELS